MQRHDRQGGQAGNRGLMNDMSLVICLPGRRFLTDATPIKGDLKPGEAFVMSLLKRERFALKLARRTKE